MVTLKDIAAEAGVSITTVSNVVHNRKSRVSEKKVAKIWEIIEREHYVPSMSARSLANDQSAIIAMVTYITPRTTGVDAVILVSSDSDYWAMIRQLDSVRFLVMLEKGKTGMAIMDTLARHEIPFCFIDDFCTAASYNIKTSTLINAIQEQINQQLAGESTKPFNVREMMETALQNSWIMMTDKEKEAFYKRYLLCMKLNVSPDGAVSITLG